MTTKVRIGVAIAVVAAGGLFFSISGKKDEPAVVAPPEFPTADEEVSALDAEKPSPQRPPPPDMLKAERMIVSDAQAALRAKDPKRALRALELHRRHFPSGKLTEEREGLKIIALVHDGRPAEATASAADFRKNYPKSLFLPLIDDALKSIP